MFLSKNYFHITAETKAKGTRKQIPCDCKKNTICCNRMKMFRCVPMLNFMHFFDQMFLFQQQTKKFKSI